LQLELSLKYSFTGLLNLYRTRRQIYSKNYFGNKEVLPDILIATVPHCDINDTFATLGPLLPEDGGTTIFRNVSNCLPLGTLLHPSGC
jgi:hypothetical protein